MTLWKEINEIPSTKRQLREFGLTVGAVLGLISVWMLWRGNAHAPYFFAAAALLVAFGMLMPAALKPIQKVWMTLALLMGWVMSRVILVVLFYLAVTPIALVLRLLGKDLLDIRPGLQKESYWHPHKPRQKEDYENQF